MIRGGFIGQKWAVSGVIVTGLATMLISNGAYAQTDKTLDRSKLPTPSGVVAESPQSDWVEIKADDLLVMDLPAIETIKGPKQRRVVIQLMSAPFSQGWVGNIKKLAKAHWWDGTAIVRVQDNYVTQWGDPTEKKALPADLMTVPESAYNNALPAKSSQKAKRDAYAGETGYAAGWSYASNGKAAWPLHCYGAVGVGRNLSPDTGSGAELYTVIGHATRQLDRNIAVVGRIVSGMEWMSSLPRGTGELGFYESPEERTTITSVRLASELPETERPRFEYMNTDSATFAKYLNLRANRHDAFYNVPAGGVDICNAPVPVRPVKQ